MQLPPKWYQASSPRSVLGVIAEAIASTNFVDLFKPTANETGAVVSVFTSGGFFGAFFAGPIGDMLGRRLTIMIGALIFCLGGGLQTGAQNLSYLYAGRCLAGVGVGFLVMIVPLYQAELCHPSIRGRVTALQQFMLGIGALVASWVSYGSYVGFPASSSKQWRVSLSIQIIPAGILAMLILLFPESPRWLIDHGKPDEGLRIQDSITFEHEHEAKSYQELFTNKSSFRRLFLAMSIQASIQMTGVSAIQYYSVKIFSLIGIAGNDALKYQAYNSIIALFAQWCCIMTIDYTGRRWTLIIGMIMNGVFFIIATALLAHFNPQTNYNYGASWGFIAMTWLYNFSFSWACGPLSWIIPAEIFDTRTRAKGVSIATMTSFAFNTMIGQTTSVAMTSIKWRWYILFCVCNFTNALFFWAILPETAKRPLEEMNYLFTNALWFVPTMDIKEYESHDLERRLEEAERKQSVTAHEGEKG